MTVRLTMRTRIMPVALCVCLVTVFVTPPNSAWAAGVCASNGKPLADGTFTLTSPFGPRGSSMHQGVDLAASEGTDIFAAMDGTVAAAGPASGFGEWIVVDSQTRTGKVSTVYGHMYADGVLVQPGAAVKEGQHIGEVGNNGQSSGPHLHFEYWEGGRLTQGQAVDPSFVLDGPSLPADATAGQQVSAAADCKTGVRKPGVVPPEFVPWLLRAGALCPGITAPLLAAQLEAENGFRHGANAPISPTGAKGPAQFMPATWAVWGKDADNSGPPPDVNSIADAVMAQGALMCENYKLCADGIKSGSITGDPVALALAAYNAGFGAVQRNHGMPSGGDYTIQTQPYVYTIMQRARAFEASPSFGGAPQIQVPAGPTPGNRAIVEAATKFKGKKWVWGGGSFDGPTRDGFDSAGLTFFAVNRGTDGKVVLPRTTDEQWSFGKEVPLDQVQPGDLVFSGWGIGKTRLGGILGDARVRPSHVGIAIGNGQMIHADPDRGVVTADFYPGSRARRAT
ncbi:peptidoglycan DD-metalloendopeptidase family protein [Mycolicibacterium wolinskyi]|uniref:peptidoglycan DD-metalloendopeptidase family protein n=1 Tax=Mycolicibacterium wolinskyi TaxID=59750 RepID=UPI00391797A3